MKLDRTDEILRDKLRDAEFVHGVPSWDEFQPKMNHRGVVRKFLPYISSAAAAAIVAVLWLTSLPEVELHKIEPLAVQKIEITKPTELLAEVVPEHSQSKTQSTYVTQVRSQIVEPEPLEMVVSTESGSVEVVQESQPETKVESRRTREQTMQSTSRATSIYRPESTRSKRKRSSANTLLAVTPFVSIGSAMDGANSMQERLVSSAIVNDMLYVQMGQYKQAVDFSRGDYSHNLPLSFGIELDFALTDRFSVGSGLVYSYLKSTALLNDRFTYKHTQQMHYLGVPINASYKIVKGKRLDLYAKVGAMAEIAVASSGQTDIFKSDKYLSSESVSVSVKGLQMSISAGVGLNVHLSQMVGIYVEPGLSHYFRNSNHPTTYYSNSQPQFNLRAGLRFQF